MRRLLTTHWFGSYIGSGGSSSTLCRKLDAEHVGGIVEPKSEFPIVRATLIWGPIRILVFRVLY